MNHGKHFRRFGRGVFKCAICERNTRLVDQGNDHLCPDCYEVAGYENLVLDKVETAEECQKGIAWNVKNIAKKGGNMERFYAQFATLFPNGAPK